MFKFGDTAKPFGFGVYGGVDEVIFCDQVEDTAEWIEQTDLPLGECLDD